MTPEFTFEVQHKKFPPELRSYFSARWDNRAIWKLALPTAKIPISDLAWHLEFPFWSSKPPEPLFDLKPIQVLEDHRAHPGHWERALSADLAFPVATSIFGGKLVILDGIHRLVHAVHLGLTSMEHYLVPTRHIQPSPNKSLCSGR